MAIVSVRYLRQIFETVNALRMTPNSRQPEQEQQVRRVMLDALMVLQCDRARHRTKSDTPMQNAEQVVKHRCSRRQGREYVALMPVHRTKRAKTSAQSWRIYT